IKTRKERRQEAEKKGEAPKQPSAEELRAEAEEEPPAVLLTVTDATGKAVRTLTGPGNAGFSRVTWGLREPAPELPKPRPPDAEDDPFFPELAGPLVMPGTYKVSLAKRVEGKVTPLAEPVEFRVVADGLDQLAEADRKALGEFQAKVVKLQRAVSGALEAANELTGRLDKVKQALDQTPGVEAKAKEAVRDLIQRNRDILRALRGDAVLRGRNYNTPTSISERVQYIVETQRFALAKPTETQKDSYEIAHAEFSEELAKLKKLLEVDLKEVEKVAEAAGAPITPGRLPEWKD